MFVDTKGLLCVSTVVGVDLLYSVQDRARETAAICSQ